MINSLKGVLPPLFDGSIQFRTGREAILRGWARRTIGFTTSFPQYSGRSPRSVRRPGCAISQSRQSVGGVCSANDEDHWFPTLEIDFVGWDVGRLIGRFIVATLACARYTAKPSTFPNAIPSIYRPPP